MRRYSLLEKLKADPSNCVPRPRKIGGNGNNARHSARDDSAGRPVGTLSSNLGSLGELEVDAMVGDCPVFYGCCTGILVQTLCCSCCCKKWLRRLFAEEKHLIKDAVCDFEFA